MGSLLLRTSTSPAATAELARTTLALATLTLATLTAAPASAASPSTRRKSCRVGSRLPLHFTSLAYANLRSVRQTVGAIDGNLFAHLQTGLDVGPVLV